MPIKITVKALYINWFSDKLISYVALRLTKYFNTHNIHATVTGITSDKSVDSCRVVTIDTLNNKIKRNFYRDTFPRILKPLISRLLSARHVEKIVAACFLKKIHPTDIIYLFPGTPLFLYKKIKKIGCIIVSERINTLRLNSKKILDAEYLRLGISHSSNLTQTSINEEIQKMQLSDFIFSPSPAVTNSLLEGNIHSSKIIQTSYGMDPEDILDTAGKQFIDGPVTILFVGSIGVRKGVHLLLAAWEEANIDGILQLVGKIDPDFREIFNIYQKNSSVLHTSFVQDLSPFYKKADIFVLPSLEEGSPLVTYLALGASLPMVVSKMGAGGVINHAKEGLVIDPHDQSQFIAALEQLAKSPTLRKIMSQFSKTAANEYTWERVAQNRIKNLTNKLDLTIN